MLSHPYLFTLAFTCAAIGLGLWLGLALRSWQVRRLKTILQVLREIMRLIQDGDLVRNIEHDGDPIYFARQGLRIISALSKANEILEDEEGE